jgi:integrase
MALTDKALKAMKPRERAYRVSDKGGVRGLNIQVTPHGQKTWTLRYSDSAGKERFYAFGEYPETSLSEARHDAIALKAKAKAEGKLEREKDKGQESVAPTVDALVAAYLSDMEDRGRATVEQIRSRLNKHAIPYIGKRIARDVTEDEINDILARIYRAGHRTMANRVRNYLLTAFKWAKQHDRDYRRRTGLRFEILTNPVADIPRDAAAERVTDRVLTWREVGQIWHACIDTISTPMRVALQLGLATAGQRPGEFLQIHDSEIDEKAMVWTLPGARTKNGRPHIVPLTDQALAFVDQARTLREKGPYLFPKRGEPKEPAGIDSLYHAAKKFCDRAGAEPWTPKDIRTTFKTLGGEIGLSKEIRDRLQNHAMTDVASRHYDHYDYLNEKRDAMAAWSIAIKSRL